MNYIDGEKNYKISESQLRYLIRCRATLEALESGGVDNWPWYGDAVREYVEDYFSDADPECFEGEGFIIEDVVEREMNRFEEV